MMNIIFLNHCSYPMLLSAIVVLTLLICIWFWLLIKKNNGKECKLFICNGQEQLMLIKVAHFLNPIDIANLSQVNLNCRSAVSYVTIPILCSLDYRDPSQVLTYFGNGQFFIKLSDLKQQQETFANTFDIYITWKNIDFHLLMMDYIILGSPMTNDYILKRKLVKNILFTTEFYFNYAIPLSKIRDFHIFIPQEMVNIMECVYEEDGYRIFKDCIKQHLSDNSIAIHRIKIALLMSDSSFRVSP